MQVPIGIRRQGQDLPDGCLRFELTTDDLSKAILLWLHLNHGVEIPSVKCIVHKELTFTDNHWTGVSVHVWQRALDEMP